MDTNQAQIFLHLMLINHVFLNGYFTFQKNNFYLKLESIAKGVGSKRINPNQIFDLDILVPPIEEQRLLLDKVTKLTSKLEKAKNEFEKQLKYLNLLQQSILDDAITGKLSKEWREKNDKSFKDKIKSPDIIPEFWKDKVKLLFRGNGKH